MKRILSVLLLVTLLVGLLAPTMAFAMANPFTRFVKTGNGKDLNVRSGPSTNNPVIMKLPYRTMVTVVDTYGDWSQIDVDDLVGTGPMWVMSSFLVTNDPGPWNGKNTPVPPTYDDVDAAVRQIKYLPEPYHAEIKTTRPSNYVHLRWIPNTSARYIDQYLAGETFMVLAESKQWAQVRIDRTGYVGFILKSCVNPLPEAVGAAN